MAEIGERLPGGNVGGAWRVGDTVRRPTGAWTPAVHALLAHLEGLPCVPRVLGSDDLGREVLTYLPGTVHGGETDELTDDQLRSLVIWTRSLHDAVRGFEHPGPWRSRGPSDATLIGHNDLGPYNVCFDGDELSGVFDWDVAGPTTPQWELALLAWAAVPLWRDIGPGRSAERLRLIADTYGGIGPKAVFDGVRPRVEAMCAGIEDGIAAGEPGMVNLGRTGEPGRSARWLAQLVARSPAIVTALG